MIKYIFDVDGVLCDTGQLIDDEFSDYFQCWSKDKTYYLVTGSHKEKTIDQAIEFHLQGNIEEASRYYQYLINQGYQDHRAFANYGTILKDLGNSEDAFKLYLKEYQEKSKKPEKPRTSRR